MAARVALSRVQGPLDPSASLDYSTKQYVDGKASAVYNGTVPSGSVTATITHNLGTTAVDVTVRDASGNEVQCANQATTANTVVLTFATAPTTNQYTVRVEGGAQTSAGLSSTTPNPVASTAAVGTGTTAARADHVHAPQAPVALTYAATIATDASLSSLFRVTLTGNATLGNPTNPVDGQKVVWEIVQDATGSRTLTLGSAFALGTDIAAVTLTTTASKRDFLGAVYNASASKWYVIAFTRGY